MNILKVQKVSQLEPFCGLGKSSEKYDFWLMLLLPGTPGIQKIFKKNLSATSILQSEEKHTINPINHFAVENICTWQFMLFGSYYEPTFKLLDIQVHYFII